MSKKRDEDDEFEGEYIGNMFGWKFSYFSLGLLVFFMVFIGVRYWITGEFPVPERPKTEQVENPSTDSLQIQNDQK